MIKKVFIAFVVISLLTCVLAFSKPDIHQAELSDIQAINGFGEVLAERVVSYLDANPNADIEDLEVIQGIGEYRVKLLKKQFR